MLSKKEIIDAYGKLMADYLILMDHSETLKKMSNASTIICNGASIVNHVFQLHIHHHTPYETLIYSGQKACFCYLEYIEQVNNTNLINSMDVGTIATFVYKQTLTNLQTLPGTASSLSDLLHLLSTVFSILMAWESDISLKARAAICEVHFVTYVKIFYNIPSVAHFYYEYLDIVRRKCFPEENLYFDFLNEFYRVLYKLKKMNALLSPEYLKEKMLLVSIHSTVITDTKQIKPFVKELFA
jgi:hypothetical protein